MAPYRFLLLILAALLGTAALACAPVKQSAPPTEHQQCVAGAEAAKAHRPDLIVTGYQCADFGVAYINGVQWVGLFDVFVKINEHYTWYSSSDYYCVAAHEWGHAWDWYRLGWTHGGYGDPEAYAQAFAVAYFGC